MKVYIVDWNVWENNFQQQAHLARRRRLFKSIEAAQNFADEIREAGRLYGFHNTVTVQEVDVYE